MLKFLPPEPLQATLQASRLSRPAGGLPELEVVQSVRDVSSRRGFLQTAGLALSVFGTSAAWSRSQEQLIFAPDDNKSTPLAQPVLPAQAEQPPALGQIPEDFWFRPRELWLRRGREEARLVYWKDGQLQSEGYWQACALLRDLRANRMTAIDPAILDVLRGITGFYQAWRWPHPVVATSGFRTAQTNAALSAEGAAKNSMHLYGRAVDIVVPGVPARDVGALAASMRQGGVGFYPSKQFTHVDTGRLRVWNGR